MNQIARCDWLPERARWSHLARSGLPAVSRKQNFTKSHIINPLLTKFVRSRWLDIGLVHFLRVFVSVHKHAKNELGQYPAILTSRLVNNPYEHDDKRFLKATRFYKGNNVFPSFLFEEILRLKVVMEHIQKSEEDSILKRIKCFPSKLRQRNLKMHYSPAILDLCLRRTLSGKSRDYRDVIVFEKLRFQNGFCPHENEKPVF